jgi:hypothetical protein
LGSDIREPMMEVNFLQKEEALWLLKLSSLGQFTDLEFQEIKALDSI